MGVYLTVKEKIRSRLDDLLAELRSLDQDPESEIKVQRILRFLEVPSAFEKLMYVGTLICLSSLLEILTILPAKTVISVYRLLSQATGIGKSRATVVDKLHVGQFLIFVSCVCLITMLSMSNIYHSIRSQSLMKFYVIYNMLDVCGRLCYTFGTDSLDAFYSIVLKSKTPLRISKAEALHFTVAFAYVIVHSFVLYFQAVTLNVSFNSNNNALFTLIMSCQFSEIKGNVFKKMDRNSLYKATCSDIAERFQLGTFIIIIMTRDLIELLAYNALGGQSSCPSDGLHAGASEAQWWSGAHTHAVLHMIYGTMVITLAPLMTIGSELLIDWIKHAFMLRLNKIDTKVYESYVSDICRNIASPEKNDKDAIPESTPNDTSSNAESLHDREHPPNISAKAARIIEFVPLPLACLLVSTYTDTIKIAFDLFFNNSDGAYKKPVFETQDIDIADELLELNRGSTVASSLVSGSSCPANYGSPEQVPEYVTFFQQRFLKKLTFIIFIYVLLLFIKLYLNQKLMKKTRGYVKKGI